MSEISEKPQVVTDHTDLDLDHQIIKQAAHADKLDHELGLWDAVKQHKAAAAWCMLMSASLIMEGYDLLLLNSFYALPSFLNRFGIRAANGELAIPPSWQNALSNGGLVGQIIGLCAVGVIQDRYGSRKTIIGGMIFLTGALFLLFFANSLGMLVAGYVLIGLPLGAFQIASTVFASEVCPIRLRPYLTCWVCMSWGIGMFLAAVVTKGTSGIQSDWAWRAPYALQWIWPLPIGLGAYFSPESPYWLVRKGRIDDAEKAVRRLTTASLVAPDYARNSVALMVHTNELEKQETAGATYADCFRGVNLRRTEIAGAVWMIQNLVGNSLVGYGATFLQQAGLGADKSFSVNLGLQSTYIIGALISWFLIGVVGSRKIYFGGAVYCCFTLLIIGILGFVKKADVGYAIGAILIAQNLVYSSSLGPVCYFIVSDMPSTRLRAKTVVLARLAYNIIGLPVNVLTQRMLNPAALNWGAKAGFFWMGSCILCAVYLYFRLPETRGRSFGEIDLLFEHHVPARKFKNTSVKQFNLDEGEPPLAPNHEISYNAFSEKMESEKSHDITHVEQA